MPARDYNGTWKAGIVSFKQVKNELLEKTKTNSLRNSLIHCLLFSLFDKLHYFIKLQRKPKRSYCVIELCYRYFGSIFSDFFFCFWFRRKLNSYRNICGMERPQAQHDAAWLYLSWDRHLRLIWKQAELAGKCMASHLQQGSCKYSHKTDSQWAVLFTFLLSPCEQCPFYFKWIHILYYMLQHSQNTMEIIMFFKAMCIVPKICFLVHS